MVNPGWATELNGQNRKENVMERNEYCDRCGDVLYPGDDYYDTSEGIYCPDCFDYIVNHIWKRYVGDVIERTE